MNIRRVLPFLMVVVALFGCRRNSSGQLVPNVPAIVAATVLGGGPVLLDPLATTSLLVGSLRLRNDLPAGTADGDIDYRVDCPPGCEASEYDVRLAPGEERVVQVFTTLVLAAVLTVTVFTVYASATAPERSFPVTWRNFAANSAAFAVLSLISVPVFAILWASNTFLSPLGVLTNNSNPLVPQRVPALAQDVRLFGAIIGLLTIVQLQQLFGDVDGTSSVTFPPGPGPEGLTVAATPSASMTAGEYVTFYLSTDADIPLAGDQLLTYSVVCDSDLDPSNDWVPSPSFPDDFYKGADRWYQLNYAPGAGWTFSCSQVTGGTTVTTVPSAARVIVRGDTVLFVVPRSEFAVSNPPFRVTTFAHTGDFGQNPPYTWSGDPTPTVAEGLKTWM